MPKMVWRVTLGAELEPGSTTEVEVETNATNRPAWPISVSGFLPGKAVHSRDPGGDGPGAGDDCRPNSPHMRGLWGRAGQQRSLHCDVPLAVR